MTDPILRLGRHVKLEPQADGELVDSRLFFTGDRNRQLVRTYPEIILRMSRARPAAFVAESLRQSPEITNFYDVHERDGHVSLVMRDEIFRQAASLDDVEFSLKVTDGGRVLRYPLPIEQFSALGHLVPLLGGDRTEREVREGLRDRLSGDALAWAESMLARWRTDGLIEGAAAPDPNFFLRSAVRPRVTFVAHTSLLVQTQSSTVLFDPLLPLRMGIDHKGADTARLKLNAICISHSHWDHCDVATLLLFDKRTPVVIPKVGQPTIFNPPIAPTLKRLGFEDIREVDFWKPMMIGDVELIPVPFHGEQDEPDAQIDHYTYVVRAGGWSLYGGVDAFRDTFGDMFEDFDRIRQEFRPTLAFLPVSRMEYEFSTGGVNGYCRAVDSTLLGKSFQYTADADLAVEWVRRLGVAWAVPYATFTFQRSAPSPGAQEFAAAMTRAGMGDRVIALRPLDSLEPSHLAAGSRAAVRRAFLNRWMRTVVATHMTDRRLRRFLAYRALRRLVVRRAPAASHDHHH